MKTKMNVVCVQDFWSSALKHPECLEKLIKTIYELESFLPERKKSGKEHVQDNIYINWKIEDDDIVLTFSDDHHQSS